VAQSRRTRGCRGVRQIHRVERDALVENHQDLSRAADARIVVRVLIEIDRAGLDGVRRLLPLGPSRNVLEDLEHRLQLGHVGQLGVMDRSEDTVLPDTRHLAADLLDGGRDQLGVLTAVEQDVEIVGLGQRLAPVDQRGAADMRVELERRVIRLDGHHARGALREGVSGRRQPHDVGCDRQFAQHGTALLEDRPDQRRPVRPGDPAGDQLHDEILVRLAPQLVLPGERQATRVEAERAYRCYEDPGLPPLRHAGLAVVGPAGVGPNVVGPRVVIGVVESRFLDGVRSEFNPRSPVGQDPCRSQRKGRHGTETH